MKWSKDRHYDRAYSFQYTVQLLIPTARCSRQVLMQAPVHSNLFDEQ